jgi:hypothetical protein
VSFSHLEIGISFTKQTILKEVRLNGEWRKNMVVWQLTFDNQVPTELPNSRTYDTKAPVNCFQIISKYVKGGFPKDQLVRTSISTGEDINNIR